MVNLYPSIRGYNTYILFIITKIRLWLHEGLQLHLNQVKNVKWLNSSRNSCSGEHCDPWSFCNNINPSWLCIILFMAYFDRMAMWGVWRRPVPYSAATPLPRTDVVPSVTTVSMTMWYRITARCLLPTRTSVNNVSAGYVTSNSEHFYHYFGTKCEMYCFEKVICILYMYNN